MGQYYKLMNLTAREYLDPHGLGHFSKAAEQSYGVAGTGQALLLLTAISSGRGGGDFHDPADTASSAVLGRWAGHAIVFVGDYTEDADLPDVPYASNLYSLCDTEQDRQRALDYLRGRLEQGGLDEAERQELTGKIEHLRTEPLFTDVSALVRPVMEANFDVRYVERSTPGLGVSYDLELVH